MKPIPLQLIHPGSMIYGRQSKANARNCILYLCRMIADYRQILIVGGGAAGMMAAISAARRGAGVVVAEKSQRTGLKLGITGKGRCNLTNTAPLGEFLEHIGPDSRFLRNVFSRFFSQHLIEFFESIGVETLTERGGRVFPASNSALEVVNALRDEMRKCGVKTMVSSAVNNILIGNSGVEGAILADGRTIRAAQVILATGGCSYPATGSTGDGYKIAESLGHSVRPAIPSLVPFITAGPAAGQMQGLTLKNINATLYLNGKKAGEEFGELLFTHFGLSGPVILTLSRRFSRDIANGAAAEIAIDLKPALDSQQLDQRLQRDLAAHGKMQYKSILRGLIPSGMVPVCLSLLALDGEKTGSRISADERKKTGRWLKDFRFKITGLRGFAEAIITSGGISTREINPATLESKLIPGLFLAGEIIDLDADTGGYNLQIAFSTGWVAGMSAADSISHGDIT